MQVRRIAPATAAKQPGQPAGSAGSEAGQDQRPAPAPVAGTVLPRHRLIECELWLTLLRAVGMAPPAGAAPASTSPDAPARPRFGGARRIGSGPAVPTAELRPPVGRGGHNG